MQSRGLACQTRIVRHNAPRDCLQRRITLGMTLDRIRASQIGNRVIYPDSRMNQGQSKITWQRTTDRFRSREPGASQVRRRADGPIGPGVQDLEPQNAWSWAFTLVTLFGALWYLITLPFRLVFWVIAWLGRLTGAALGFSLMVVGIALMAGPLYIIGIPLFLVGLVVTLRCLE
jgi:hypothetical protein